MTPTHTPARNRDNLHPLPIRTNRRQATREGILITGDTGAIIALEALTGDPEQLEARRKRLFRGQSAHRIAWTVIE